MPTKTDFIPNYILIISLIFAILFFVLYFNELDLYENPLSEVIYSFSNLKYLANVVIVYQEFSNYIHSNELANTISALPEKGKRGDNKNPARSEESPEVPPISSKELHWEYMPLSFTFSNPEDCGGFQTRRILKAFDEIQNATLGKVSFVQINGTANITIICNKGFLPSTEPGLIQSGETTWKYYGARLVSAKVNFYNTAGDNYNGGCRNYPDVEIHEILHTFAFEHTNESYDIMNPIGTYCPTKINQNIIDKLMSIYG